MFDVEETKRRGYKHPKSRVRFDGSEVLHGKDWKKRKRELWVRAGGRCERMIATTGPLGYERCRSEGHDPHHKITRSRHRDDRLENLELLCRLHHDLLDPRKIRWTSSHPEGLSAA